ncbi:MAG TPA: HAD family hydrolase, partial [Flavobacterium sp.]|jgi:putative hydrolase of the HAD superfamily|nr:HAD family hydrolase [Flavobacterium sp.]
MQPFDDYQILRALPCKKFLVTMGFTKMQQAKVDKLNLADDFEGIYIIDPEHSSKSKKDVFVEIMENNSFSPDDLLVIGDDPDSEVRGAQELGIDAVLYDRINVNPNYGHGPRITNYGVLHQYLA